MTDERIALRELLEKGSDATFLREMIGFAAQRDLEAPIAVKALLEPFVPGLYQVPLITTCMSNRGAQWK
jgi:hypothetical protein